VNGFEGLIRRLVKNLNVAGIEYMFTGALAASYYGMRGSVLHSCMAVSDGSELSENLCIRIIKRDKELLGRICRAR